METKPMGYRQGHICSNFSWEVWSSPVVLALLMILPFTIKPVLAWMIITLSYRPL